MKKFVAKYASAVLGSLATLVVATTASVAWIHNPQVPTELLKK